MKIYKGECIFIPKNNIIKNLGKIFTFIAIITLLATIIILVKFKPLYKVTLSGEVLGYINNKENIEEVINNYLKTTEGNIAFIDLQERPEYELKLVSGVDKTVEEEVLLKVKEKSKIVYKFYAIAMDGENKTYVNTMEEAEKVVAELKEEYEGKIELNIAVREIYTENLETINSTEISVAKANIESDVNKKVEIQSHSINGVYLVNPVKGTITSRYGARSSIRSSTHTGLDIAAPTGTGIYACAEGTVTFAGTKGSFGKLVKISHSNGVETWYAHCSAIYVSVGDTVEQGEKIAAVGSTGNSTGPHLHLEVRLDGQIQNPQNYIYK